MIQSHLAAIEQLIIALSKIQNNAGHSLHKGTPREVFIKNFLEKHLGSTVSFGTGEIIDKNSKPKESRNQHDIVIFRNEFPKLDFQGGITAFLAESVIATIEVKSLLVEDEFKKAFISAMRCKEMERNFHEGIKMWHSPPKILNYIVAYDGPQQMQTIYGWIKSIESELQIAYQEMPATREERVNVSSPGIDGVFILGKGFIHFDNFVISHVNPKDRQDNPSMKWIFTELEVGNLLLLFLNLSQIICSYPQKAIQLIPYMKEMSGQLRWGK